MTYRSAAERHAEILAEGERRRQARRDAPPVPAWRTDPTPPFDDFPAYTSGVPVTSQQPYLTASERVYAEQAALEQRRREVDAGQRPAGAQPDASARALAERAMGYAGRSTAADFEPDPSISQSARVLAERLAPSPEPERKTFPAPRPSLPRPDFNEFDHLLGGDDAA